MTVGGTRATAIIPARIGSTRFPRKMLAADTGRPLICHVIDAARRAPRIARVAVATDSPEILSVVLAAGAEGVLTSPDHPNGTSRIDEAASVLRLPEQEVIVNVQGDEPEIEPGVIDGALRALLDASPERDIGTAAARFAPDEDPADPNMVKVVRDAGGAALYFSRARIPFVRDASGDGPGAAPLRHVGIYAYRRAFLRKYAAMAPTPLERAESLEQLRALEHAAVIGVEIVERARPGIDTPEQYAAFVARWRASGAV